MNYKTAIATAAAGIIMAGCSGKNPVTNELYNGPADKIYTQEQLADVKKTLGVQDISTVACNETITKYGTRTRCEYMTDAGKTSVSAQPTFVIFTQGATKYSIDNSTGHLQFTKYNAANDVEEKINPDSANYEQIRPKAIKKLGDFNRIVGYVRKNGAQSGVEKLLE